MEIIIERKGHLLSHIFKPKNNFQEEIVKSFKNCDVVIAEGVAGTGKTYIGAGLSVEYLLSRRLQRIVVTRPAVDAGEKIGFLPGTKENKIEPYLLPVMELLEEILGLQKVEDLIKKKVLEGALVGFMRGRTLSNSFIVIDEAQNLTIEQMKMLLTRFGENVKVLIQGDLGQSDVGHNNGLRWAIKEFSDCSLVKVHTAKLTDVIRSPLTKGLLEHLDAKNTVSENTKITKRAASA